MSDEMLYYSDPMTEIYHGDIREVVKELAPASCDMIMTSPPFYGLRAYKIPDTIWDGKEGCAHEWESPVKLIKHHAGETNPGLAGYFKNDGAMDDKGGSYCSLCGAWKGCLGNEPHPDDRIVEVEIMELRQDLTTSEIAELRGYFGDAIDK